ncbi:dicer-like protein, partial [Aureobasidium melanogenum]
LIERLVQHGIPSFSSVPQPLQSPSTDRHTILEELTRWGNSGEVACKKSKWADEQRGIPGSLSNVNSRVYGRSRHTEDPGPGTFINVSEIEVFDDLSVCMTLFSVMGFIEYEEIDLAHGDEGAAQTTFENIRGTDNDMGFGKTLVPDLLAPFAPRRRKYDEVCLLSGLGVLPRCTLEEVKLILSRSGDDLGCLLASNSTYFFDGYVRTAGDESTSASLSLPLPLPLPLSSNNRHIDYSHKTSSVLVVQM